MKIYECSGQNVFKIYTTQQQKYSKKKLTHPPSDTSDYYNIGR
jgi:hypothetical protein